MRSKLIIILTALSTLAVAPATRAADLVISDLSVFYDAQTTTTATGQVSFNVRLQSDESDTLGFDLFSSQVLVRQLIATDPTASFSLNEASSELEGPAKDDYWINSTVDGSQNASTVGDEFRYTDFLPLGTTQVPAIDAVVASFTLDFEVTDVAQFGTYEIAAGNASFNFFSRDLIIITPTNLETITFELDPFIPEPTTGLLGVGALALMICRRRRTHA